MSGILSRFRAYRQTLDPVAVEDARKRLVVAVVGLFGALGFRGMVGNVEKELPHLTIQQGLPLSPTIALCIAFGFLAVSFMIGILHYLLIVHTKDSTSNLHGPAGSRKFWLWDFLASLLTLILLLLLSLFANEDQTGYFLWTVACMFLFQSLWIITHWIPKHRLPVWWIRVNFSTAAATTLLAANHAQLPVAGPYVVLAIATVIFFYDVALVMP